MPATTHASSSPTHALNLLGVFFCCSLLPAPHKKSDLVNEPSRWGCQWERDCSDASGTLTCAPGAELYHRATMAIHNWDPNVVIFANAMGQSHVDPHRFPQCSNPFRGE